MTFEKVTACKLKKRVIVFLCFHCNSLFGSGQIIVRCAVLARHPLLYSWLPPYQAASYFPVNEVPPFCSRPLCIPPVAQTTDETEMIEAEKETRLIT